MAWLICIACHHTAQGRGMPRKGHLVCNGCGSRVARAVRVMKPAMFNGGQTEAGAAKVMTYAGLLSIARERGYRVGWAGMKYRAIYGVWPNIETEPRNPSAELMWWIKRESIAYAKAHFPREKKVMPEEKPSELMNDDDWGIDL
jgi:hypothetical protein